MRFLYNILQTSGIDPLLMSINFLLCRARARAPIRFRIGFVPPIPGLRLQFPRISAHYVITTHSLAHTHNCMLCVTIFGSKVNVAKTDNSPELCQLGWRTLALILIDSSA